MNSHQPAGQLLAATGTKPVPGQPIPDDTLPGETVIPADSFHQPPVVVLQAQDAPEGDVPAELPLEGQDAVAALDPENTGNELPPMLPSMSADAAAEAVLEALLAGRDISAELEATAAGLGGGGGDEAGHGFLRLGRVSESTTPVSFDYPTEPGGAGPVEEQRVLIPEIDNGVEIIGLTPPPDGDASVGTDEGPMPLNENDLPWGSDADPESTVATGSFIISAPDGVGSLVIDGHVVILNDNFTPTTFITSGQGNALSVSITGYNPATGEVFYSYELLDNEDHAAPPSGTDSDTNSIFDTLEIVLTDTDGDSVTGELVIRIVDDVPEASLASEAPSLRALVDESLPTLGGADDDGIASASLDAEDVQAQFDSVIGADQDGADITFSLELNTGEGDSVGSGLFAVDAGEPDGKGEEILLMQDGNTITGYIGENDYFTLSIDPDTGEVTLTLLDNIWHSNDENPDDAQTLLLEEGTLLLRQTLTDGDGDTDSTAFDLGAAGVFMFEDDGPTQSVGVDAEAAAALATELDETTGNDDHYADGESPDTYVNDDNGYLARTTSTVEGGLTALFSASGSYGSDGAGSVTESLSFSGMPEDGLVTSLIATDGGAVTLYSNEDGTLLTGLDGDGHTVLTIAIVTVDDVPQLQTTLYEALDNGSDDTFDEAVSLLLSEGGSLELEYRVTRTDGDGDSITVDDSIVLANEQSSVFSFDDDGPTQTVTADAEAAAALATELDETTGDSDRYADGETTDTYVNDDNGYLARTTSTVEGGLTALFSASGSYGSDGAGSVSESLSFSGVPEEGLATSLIATDGGAVTLYSNEDGTVLTGLDGDGHTVLTIAIVTVDDVPQLQTTLYEALDNGSDDTFDEAVSLLLSDGGSLELEYRVTRTDGDGDSITVDDSIVLANEQSSVFSFDDDGPTQTVTADAEAAAALATELDETTGDSDHYADGETTDTYVNDDNGYLARTTSTVEGGLTALFSANGSFGSDGAGSVTESLSFSGVPEEGLATSLIATDGGAVTLYSNEDGTVLTGLDGDGHTVLTIELVTVDDVPQLQTTLYEALDNGSDDTFDEAVSLLLSDGGSLELEYSVTRTDGDGDSITVDDSIVLADGQSSVFSFDDDGPTQSVEAGAEAAAQLATELDETTGNDDHYADGESPDTYVNDDNGYLARTTSSIEGGLTALFSASGSYGSDGAGSVTESLSFSGVPEDGLVTSLIATDGGAVTLYSNEDGTLLTGLDGDGHTVLTIAIVTVDDVPQLQTTLYEALDNGSDDTFDEAVSLLLSDGGSLELEYSVTRTDGDGDSITVDDSIVLADSQNSVFSFDDDGPTQTVDADAEAAAALATELDETTGDSDHYADGETTDTYVNDDNGYLARTTSTVEGGLTALFSASGSYGSDGAGSVSESLSFSGVPEEGLATSLIATDGGAVTLYSNEDGTVLTGLDGDGHTVLTIELVTVDDVPQLQTTLYEALDNGSDDTFDEAVSLLLSDGGSLELEYSVTRTDGDGDSITVDDSIVLANEQSSVFSFDDDGPTAIDDTAMLTEDEDMVSGNVFNDGDAGDDDPGSDGASADGPVTGIAFGANPVSTNVSFNGSTWDYSVTGDYGVLYMNKDGSWVYDLDQESINAQGLNCTDAVETFSYTITDRDGDSDTASLAITIDSLDDATTNLNGHIWIPVDDAQMSPEYIDGYPLQFKLPQDIDNTLEPDMKILTIPDPDLATLYYNGTAVEAGDIIPITALDDILLVPNPDLDLEGLDGDPNTADFYSGTFSVEYTLTDDCNNSHTEIATYDFSLATPEQVAFQSEQVGDGSSPLTSGNDQEQEFLVSEELADAIASSSDLGSLQVILYTDYQKAPFETIEAGDTQDPDPSTTEQKREDEVTAKLIINGVTFYLVIAGDANADTWSIITDPDDPNTGLATTSVNYDQIMADTNNDGILDTTLEQYLIDNPQFAEAGTSWNLVYEDNDGGSYQARFLRASFYFDDPGNQSITVDGSNVQDTVYGTDGNDSLSGQGDFNILIGRAGNDELNGGPLEDTLIGGTGNDTMTGGTGADVFVWNLNDGGTTIDPAIDTITDFTTGAEGDQLDLRDLLVGEEGAPLTDYLHFEDDGVSTTISISTTGQFDGSNYATTTDQQIVLESTLLAGATDTDIINNLLSTSNLRIDT